VNALINCTQNRSYKFELTPNEITLLENEEFLLFYMRYLCHCCKQIEVREIPLTVAADISGEVKHELVNLTPLSEEEANGFSI
jgi:hypothetical protein